MKIRSGTLFPGVFAAGMLAGPIFLLAVALANLYLQLPRPIAVDPGEAGLIVMGLLPATILGALIGLPANVLGGNLMAALGRKVALARPPLAWACAGLAIGLALVFLPDWDMGAEPAFALVATSTLCATLCRRWVSWIETD